ncbi:MAG: OadG family transporter subunit [Eubacteriales bacterium]|nr:hypothetical protein [Sarcina sp.]MBR2730267.1 OadG family protein [Lachnospiraceae bacterium]MDO4417247.1 OadG family transporter subunit [Eubacteriales bacterium]
MSNKLKGLIAVLACILALTACGGSGAAGQEEIPEETRSALFGYTEMTAQSLDEIVTSGAIEEQKEDAVVYAGLQSWESAKEEIGSLDFSVDADGNGVADCFTEKTVILDDEGNYVVTVGVTGETKNADLVCSYTHDLTGYASIVTNVEYSFGELMQQAGLNTLLGMGTTFTVLILLSLIIALFGHILSTQSKKKAEAEERKEKEEESRAGAVSAGAQGLPAGVPSEGTLVAVIAAAVAAYRSENEPGVSPDGFVVRKIRRIRRS